MGQTDRRTDGSRCRLVPPRSGGGVLNIYNARMVSVRAKDYFAPTTFPLYTLTSNPTSLRNYASDLSVRVCVRACVYTAELFVDRLATDF